MPRPSKLFVGMPRKSRTRGRDRLIIRSRNSYIRAPRRVTRAPTGMPARRLKFEIAFLARVMTGRWPVIIASSSTTPSSCLGFLLASPMPTFSTIFSSRGTCIGLVSPNVRASAGRIVCS